MTNIENYIFNIENDNITKKGAQALLSNVICELGFLSVTNTLKNDILCSYIW